MKIWLTDFFYPDIKAEKELVEQKSIKWTEEDEKMLTSFIHKIEICDLLTNKEDVWITKRLKSLKERLQ